MPNLTTYLNQILIFEGYVVRCAFKNAYQKDTCLKEIGLHAQNMTTILGSIVNIIGGRDRYDHLMSTKTFNMLIKEISIRAPKIMRKVAIASTCIC